jgi:hypothetical protein
MTETKELRYRIQMCRSQEELDLIVRRNRAAIHEHSFMRFVIENTRRNIRHIEHANAICKTYLQN